MNGFTFAEDESRFANGSGADSQKSVGCVWRTIQERAYFIGAQLPVLATRETLLEFHFAHARTQHATHQSALPLEQLPDVLAAGSARLHGVPAVGAFGFTFIAG